VYDQAIGRTINPKLCEVSKNLTDIHLIEAWKRIETIFNGYTIPSGSIISPRVSSTPSTEILEDSRGRDHQNRTFTITTYEKEQIKPEYSQPSSTTIPNSIPSCLKGKPIHTWTMEDVSVWFSSLPLSQDYSSIIIEQEIDGDVLMNDLNEISEWKSFGFQIMGDISKLRRAKGILKMSSSQ